MPFASILFAVPVGNGRSFQQWLRANIVDFDFHVSSGFIYWADFIVGRKLSVHRIKPDGSDYAEVVSVATISRIRNISALAINWVEGMMCGR